jgi:predicted nucleic acid-binding protein
MAYLFDTDAISELLKKTPLVAYANWVAGLRREDQFTSSVVIAEPGLNICRVLSDARAGLRPPPSALRPLTSDI